MLNLEAAVQELERTASVTGPGESFSGYGVMSLPLSSGWVLALRRFPASSIGPAYSAVWMREPGGAWRFYSDAEPDLGCGRYFGPSLAGYLETAISLSWPTANTLRVSVPAMDFDWTVVVGASPATRLMNLLASALPERAWGSRRLLRAMGRVAGLVLRAGRITLTGRVPSGHGFEVAPRRVWVVRESTARLGGIDLGVPSPLPRQVALGDFALPQRGLFAIGDSSFAASRAAGSA